MNIVLASASPRRRELLSMMGFENFKVIPDESEEQVPHNLSPAQTVCAIALNKAKNVSLLCCDNEIVIAADTLVYLEGRPLGKPENDNHAISMLRELSGRRHTVYTGIAVVKGDVRTTAFEQTDVFFREISDEEIRAYVKTGEPMDKAGAYGAQGRGAVFIERIEGDFFNVMGLPICRLSIMLRGLVG